METFLLTKVVYIFGNLITATGVQRHKAPSCGVDNSPMTVIYEGLTRIEYYPWIGVLYYPQGRKRFTTVVVLVTKQIVLAAASEIDSMPKDDFRERSRVILGHNCSSPSIGVRDYVYHPEYRKSSFSAIALIQLDLDNVKQRLRPICAPPTHFLNPEFYAMSLTEDCRKSRIRIHRMNYVAHDECRRYYRRSGLDVKSMWPAYAACASAESGGECLWRSGTVLAMQQGKQWHLIGGCNSVLASPNSVMARMLYNIVNLGFGIYGPGCEAPARFVDYGIYQDWVRSSVERIGRPAITRVSHDHLVLRRAISHLQRFGVCDSEEKKWQLYQDHTNISTSEEYSVTYRRARHNITLYSDTEYSCVEFRVHQDSTVKTMLPLLRIRRWCAGPRGLCHDFQFLEMQFHIDIYFVRKVTFSVRAYGKRAKTIDVAQAMLFANNKKKRPEIFHIDDIKNMLDDQDYKWFN